MNVQQKSVHVSHTVKKRDFSLQITGKVIIFRSFRWANDIFATIKQLGIVCLDVSFVNEMTHASDELVVEFLKLILTHCVNSINVLKLWDLDYLYFDTMQNFHSNDGPIFQNLKEITLKNIFLNRDILQMFSHTKILRLFDPPNVEFGSETSENIPFNNLDSLFVSFDKSNTFIGAQSIPIISNTVQHIQIFDTYRASYDSNDISISIPSLASMNTINVLMIVGGARFYSIRELNELNCKNTLTKLTVPLKKSANIKQVQEFICDAWQLILSKFILDQLSLKERKKFEQHRTIQCKNHPNAQYEVIYTDNGYSFFEYTVRKIDSTSDTQTFA